MGNKGGGGGGGGAGGNFRAPAGPQSGGNPKKKRRYVRLIYRYSARIQGCMNVQGQKKSYIAAINHRSKNMQCM